MRCARHDVLLPWYTQHGMALYRFSDFALSDLLLSSRTFSFDTCFLLCRFFSEAFLLSFVSRFSITLRPGQVFSLRLQASLGGMHVGHLTEDKVQPHGYVAGTHTLGWFFV